MLHGVLCLYPETMISAPATQGVTVQLLARGQDRRTTSRPKDQRQVLLDSDTVQSYRLSTGHRYRIAMSAPYPRTAFS